MRPNELNHGVITFGRNTKRMDPQRSRGPPSSSRSRGRRADDDDDAATVLTTLPDGSAVRRPDPLSVYMYTELHNANKANADAPKPESTDDLASVVSRVRQGRPAHTPTWTAPSQGILEEEMEHRSSAGGSSHGQGADWGGMAPYGQFMGSIAPPAGTRSPSASTLHHSVRSSGRRSGSYQSSVSLGRHGEPPYAEPPPVARPLVPNPGQPGFFDDLVSKNNTRMAGSESSSLPTTEESEDEESIAAQEDVIQRSHGPPTARKGSKENGNSRIRREKQAYLIELDAMKLNGITLSREFTMDDMLDEITFEYVRHARNEEAREAVATMKQYVLYFVAGVLVVNHFAKIFDLTGWTEAVQSKLEDPATRPLLHRLYRKWFRRGPPNEEMQLVFMIGGSLITTHLMNKGLNSLAGNDATKQKTAPTAPAMFGGQGGGNGLGLGSIMSLLGGLGGGNGAGGGIGDLLGTIFTGDAAPKPAQPPPPTTNTTARAPMAPPAL